MLGIISNMGTERSTHVLTENEKSFCNSVFRRFKSDCISATRRLSVNFDYTKPPPAWHMTVGVPIHCYSWRELTRLDSWKLAVFSIYMLTCVLQHQGQRGTTSYHIIINCNKVGPRSLNIIFHHTVRKRLCPAWYNRHTIYDTTFIVLVGTKHCE